jgi:hypothetical protein
MADDAVELSERIQNQTVLLCVWHRGAGNRFFAADSSEEHWR